MRRILKGKLDSMLPKCFPLTASEIIDFSHLSPSVRYSHKSEISDYFSHTPQLLFDTKTQKIKKAKEKGLWGLPSGKEIGTDLIV